MIGKNARILSSGWINVPNVARKMFFVQYALRRIRYRPRNHQNDSRGSFLFLPGLAPFLNLGYDYFAGQLSGSSCTAECCSVLD